MLLHIKVEEVIFLLQLAGAGVVAKILSRYETREIAADNPVSLRNEPVEILNENLFATRAPQIFLRFT